MKLDSPCLCQLCLIVLLCLPLWVVWRDSRDISAAQNVSQHFSCKLPTLTLSPPFGACFSMYKLKAETRRHFKSKDAAKHLPSFFKKPVPTSHNRKTALATVSAKAYLQFCNFNRFLHWSMVTEQNNPQNSHNSFWKIKLFFLVPKQLMVLSALQHHLALGDIKEMLHTFSQ